MRAGYVEIAPGVSTPRENVEVDPTIRWNHIDGPLLQWAGHMHWLTWGERFKLWLGLTSPSEIARERFPTFRRLRPPR